MLLIKTEKYPRKQISKQCRAKFKQALRNLEQQVMEGAYHCLDKLVLWFTGGLRLIVPVLYGMMHSLSESNWASVFVQDWNPDFGKPYQYVPVPTNDIRIGGVGTNYYRHIKGTEDQYLYNTQRYDLEGFKVKVPNGNYKVTFLFSETMFNEPEKRVFHLKIQDSEILRNIDVFKAAGRDSAYTITSGIMLSCLAQ